MTKSLSHSVGGYLPNTLAEMWEPTRDFASLKLPTSGARTVVALSGFVSALCLTLDSYSRSLNTGRCLKLWLSHLRDVSTLTALIWRKAGNVHFSNSTAFLIRRTKALDLLIDNRVRKTDRLFSLIFVLFSGPIFFSAKASARYPSIHALYLYWNIPLR